MLKALYRQIRRLYLVARIQRQRQRGEGRGVDWHSGLVEENDFWEQALTDPANKWDLNEYRERTNPDLELQAELKELIPALPGATIRLLDVGAGPLTRLGKKWQGRKIEITATDPLAEKYSALVKRLGIPTLVPIQSAQAEKLTEHFPRDHFDLAYASNCLDHSCDPILAIQQMIAVVKPGHPVYLWHFSNVGKSECYTGLHQWNFDVKGGDFVVDDGRTTVSLKAKIGSAAVLSCSETRAFGSRVVIALLKKAGR